MKIEEEIFNSYIPNYEKLKAYGFEIFANIYTYSKTFLNDDFKALITIDNKGEINVKVIEEAFNEEFALLRVDSYVGAFASQVRDAYKEILLDIRDNCFNKQDFISKQANRISKLIKKTFNESPDYPFDQEKYKNYGVFRNKDNNKWYGLIMNVKKSLLEDIDSEEYIDVINVKVDENQRKELLEIKGIYPSYHMNKEKWISIALDESLTDEKIMNLIKCSRDLVSNKKRKNSGINYWIQPANPAFYDLKAAFIRDKGTTIWKQSRNVNIGDICYMYIAKPVGAIKYKCEIVEINIPYEYKSKEVSMHQVMKIKLLKEVEHDNINFPYLKSIGVNLIRGPVLIDKDIANKIERIL